MTRKDLADLAAILAYYKPPVSYNLMTRVQKGEDADNTVLFVQMTFSTDNRHETEEIANTLLLLFAKSQFVLQIESKPNSYLYFLNVEVNTKEGYES